MPSFWIIGNKETVVYDVFLGGGAWEGLPAGARDRHFRVRAIVEIKVDEQALSHGVWTGRVLSTEKEYVFHKGGPISPSLRVAVHTVALTWIAPRVRARDEPERRDA